MATVQVKHIMHYLGGLFSFSVMDVFCLYVFILSESERELLFFLQRDKIVFAFAFTHASSVCACWLKPLSVSSLCP